MARRRGAGAGTTGDGMSATRVAALRATTPSETLEALLRQYGGPIQLTGSADAFYERHLLFDNVADPAATGLRERYEALARSIRDVLSQRWVRTEQTYERLDPKRVYYLSMEFLIGRSLTNNITNLLLSPFVHEAVKQAQASMNWLGMLEEEPDAGLGNGGLGRLAACFLDSMATLQFPAMGYGLRYEYGMFRQSLDGGWQREQPDNWLRRPDPWEVARPDDKVEIELNCSFEVRGGTLSAIPGRPTRLIGIPFDRPVVGYGGKTINTLRLWAANAGNYFDFQAFSHGDFIAALAETLAAESLTRVLYPDDSTTQGQGLRFVQEYFLVACSLTDLIRRFRRTNGDWTALPEKVAIQLNDTHPAIAVPELMRILLDEARLGWDQAWDLSQRTLAYTNHTLGAGHFQAGNPSGKNLHFGIREHAMAAAVNGMSLSKLRPFGATFFIFSDYARPSIRLSALMELPAIFVFTHDAMGDGEDGPTHQPVEHLASLRAIPGLVTLRPGDANEVVEAYRYVMQLRHQPAALVLSRQPLPTLDRRIYAPAAGVARGAYVLADAPGGNPEVILIASGSELGLAVEAHAKLLAEGIRSRVVSMPSWEIFEQQTQEYRDSALPPAVKARVAIEQASVFGWERYVGASDHVIGMKTFGASAPLKELQRKFGFEPDRLVAAAKALLQRA